MYHRRHEKSLSENLRMKKIVLATGNQGKVKEIAGLLADQGYEVLPQSEFNVIDADETGTTFVENAIIKARHAAKETGLPAIADDSGLAVDFLNGAPGVYSARYAGDNASDQDNIDKLLVALDGVEPSQRSAQFHCVLVYMPSHDCPTPIICHGIWHGEIAMTQIGSEGFGYDPIFWLESEKMTSAQLSRELKNSLSHRGTALTKLVKELSK